MQNLSKVFFLSSGYPESSDWAFGPSHAQIQVVWPFPPTIAPRDPFFYPMRGKEDLDVIVAPLFYHSWMRSVFLTIQTVSLTFQYTRRAFIKFSQIHVPCFKWCNADPTVWGLHGNLSGIRPAHNSSSPLWILWEPTPTRFHLLYKAPRGIVLTHFADSWVLEKSQALHFYEPSQWPW